MPPSLLLITCRRGLLYAAGFPYPTATFPTNACKSDFGLQLIFSHRPAVATSCFKLRATYNTSIDLVAPYNFAKWPGASLISATVISISLEVGTACGGGVSGVTVGGVAKAFTFSTGGASGVLNVTGLSIAYESSNNVQVGWLFILCSWVGGHVPLSSRVCRAADAVRAPARAQ